MLQAYPEFCRALYNAAPESFNVAAADWEKLYGKVRPVIR
jgi:hypothetical protein